MSISAKFIICTRSNSRRVPNKPHVKINGKPIIEHLIDRLIPITKPVYLAIPLEDEKDYLYLREKYKSDIKLYCAYADDPLKRMYHCAEAYGIKDVIRVTHDKIFIDADEVYSAIDCYHKRGLDYLYSSSMTSGTAFEIISKKVLRKASQQYSKVEHISYAVKSMTKNYMDIDFSKHKFDTRLLIDFPEDVTFMQTIFACLGNDVKRSQVYSFLNENTWANKINELPLVTVYTCSKDNETTVDDTIRSVYNQDINFKMEYILVDDFSTDKTPYLMSQAAAFWGAQYIRNDENIGLASSSNRALSRARGKYIIRLDADDYFSNKKSLQILVDEISNRDCDVIYPGFYDGSMNRIGDPMENHHPAGALFKTRALNHIKFTDKLRHFDGMDLYLRAKEQLKIGYYKKPLFFYRDNPKSLSRNSKYKKIREEIKQGLSIV